jgi:hypothetical protein
MIGGISTPSVITLLAGSVATILAYFGLFLLLGANYLVSSAYYARLPGAVPSLDLEQLSWGIKLGIVGAVLLGLGLLSLTDALLTVRTNLFAAAGYILILLGFVSMIFIFTLPLWHLGGAGEGVAVSYPFAISGVLLGIGLLHLSGKRRRI